MWSTSVRAVRDFFAPRHTPGTIRPALVNAAISTVTVLLCCLLFTPQLGVISLLGALTPFWETGRPLWARVRNGLLVSAGLTASMSAGVLVAPLRWAVVPASVLVILVVGVVYQTFMLTRGPSPVMMFYAAVLGTFFGTDARVGWSMVGVTAFASVLTTVFLLVPLVVAPRGPERRAVAGAERAVSAYRRVDPTDEAASRLARNAALQAVSSGWLMLRSAWPADRGRAFARLTGDLDAITRDLADTVEERAGRDRRSVPAGGRTALPFGRPRARYLLGHALRWDSVEWFTTWRMALAAGIAGIAAELLGIGHPYWAILTGTVVINQWTDRVAATRRAAHRTVGTLLGAGVVAAVSLLDPSPWAAAAVVVFCMIAQYLLFPLNYALALVFITPMALLAVEVGGTGGTAGTLALDRLVATVIGALAAVAVTWATSVVVPRRLVRAQSARAAHATAEVERLDAAGETLSVPGRRARTELEYELIHHVGVVDRAVADDPRLRDLAPLEHLVADRGYAALAAAWGAPPEVGAHEVPREPARRAGVRNGGVA